MSAPMQSLTEIFGEPIHVYSRADAFADGQLIDVSDRAREFGIAVPVALTAAAWADTVAWTQDCGWQDEPGRLTDVLGLSSMVLRMHIRAKNPEVQSGVPVRLVRVPNRAGAEDPEEAVVYAAISGGDNGEPVVTIMLASDR